MGLCQEEVPRGATERLGGTLKASSTRLRRVKVSREQVALELLRLRESKQRQSWRIRWVMGGPRVVDAVSGCGSIRLSWCFFLMGGFVSCGVSGRWLSADEAVIGGCVSLFIPQTGRS